MGAVRCSKHGTHTAGPFCCDHVREAIGDARPRIPFGIYRGDLIGDGSIIVAHMLCTDCASKFGLSVDAIAPAEVCASDERFPYVCPVCAQCFREWSAAAK